MKPGAGDPGQRRSALRAGLVRGELAEECSRTGEGRKMAR